MTTPKNIAIVQSGGLTGNRLQDLASLLSLYRRAAQPGTDLVVFPELATTPYFGSTGNADYRQWAETVDGPTVTAFSDSARELGVPVVLGFYELREDGQRYNSAVALDATGEVIHGRDLEGRDVATYRKTSIPQSLVGQTPVDEKYFFTPGDGPALFHIAGMRISFLICYDRSFPEYWLGARALGADVVIPLVSSLGSREQLFLTELQTRAMETQTWVIAANRGGEETLDGQTTSYFGLSCVVTPAGELVSNLPAHRADEILRTTIDLSAVAEVRSAFPLGRDRVPGMLERIQTAFLSQKRVEAAA